MPGQKSTARMGRPTLLDQVVRYKTVDGAPVPVTAGEQVIERRRLGLDQATAAASAGVSKQTLYQWRLDGARARAIEARGERQLTATEEALRKFVDALERAEAEWEAGNLAIIQRAAQGGHTITKTTTKVDGAGTVVEQITVTETLAPQWTAAAWQLERMRQDRYVRRMELTGAEGAPLIPEQDQARALTDSLRQFQADARKHARPAQAKATKHAPRTRKPKERTEP